MASDDSRTAIDEAVEHQHREHAAQQVQAHVDRPQPREPAAQQRSAAARTAARPRRAGMPPAAGGSAPTSSLSMRVHDRENARPRTTQHRGRMPRTRCRCAAQRFIASKNSPLVLVSCILSMQELGRRQLVHRVQQLAQDPDLLQLVRRRDQLFAARAGAVDVERRVDALLGDAAVEVDFAVAGALELFVDHVVHARAGVDQRGGEDRQRPPSSMLRAAPKKRFGRCSALASTPPVSTLPELGTTVL